MDEVLSLRDVSKSYRAGGQRITVLRQVACEVRAGEVVILLGRSGSGKTTLLSLAGGLDRPDSGRVLVDGHDVTDLPDESLTRLRRRTVGWMSQSSGLLPLLTAAENVALALRILGTSAPTALEQAREALRTVGVEARADHRSHELSGGEQQRVALARALVKSPRLLLADEPTGQLDSETAAEVARLLRNVTSQDMAVLLATHDRSLLQLADRVLTIGDGRLRDDSPAA
ncbi:MAG: ABC transporter ATP-binding protein [Candidatus Dormibacteraeota bacterium]|nr:ABC transporter ATP-binding protein [Candidatus Dormibacteraeota bacterium]